MLRGDLEDLDSFRGGAAASDGVIHTGFQLHRIARDQGVSVYVGDGLNRWTAVHRLDAARLSRLALEKGAAGTRFHGVAEEGIALRDIAGVIGRRLRIPVVAKSPKNAASHIGWFAAFAGLDCPASSKLTRERLGWHPVQPSLLADLERCSYFKKLSGRRIRGASWRLPCGGIWGSLGH